MKGKKRRTIMTVMMLVLLSAARAQDNPEPAAPTGFPKDRLFAGGSVTLGFSGNSFQAGLSPFLGYNLTPWLDGALTVNYNYTSFRNVAIVNPNDKIRMSTYGGGAFLRIYPVRMAFLQVQPEHNFVTQRFLPGDGTPSSKTKDQANSLLLGVGLASTRYPGSGQPFFYISLLFDVLNQEFSPYTSSTGNIVPILRAGLQVPLFQHAQRYLR